MKTETIKSREQEAQNKFWNDTDNFKGKGNKKSIRATATKKLPLFHKAIIIIGAISLGTSLAFFFKRKKINQYRLKIEDLKAEIALSELKTLSANMNPHFIFNALNSLHQFVCKNDKKPASDFINQFALIMRKTLINSEKMKVLLEDDLELLRLYLELESARLDHKFMYSLKVEPTIKPANTLVPPGIIQPLVENSIWHGITPLDRNGKIKIRVKKDDGKLIYYIKDNGVGRTHSKDNLKESRGISITRKRIELLNQIEKSNGEFKISDRNKGVSVKVELPFEKAF